MIQLKSLNTELENNFPYELKAIRSFYFWLKAEQKVKTMINNPT